MLDEYKAEMTKYHEALEVWMDKMLKAEKLEVLKKIAPKQELAKALKRRDEEL